MSDAAVGASPRRGAATAFVRPQPAASLIVVDRDGPAPRVLMGRRHGGASFMPQRWVFPGGRCDPDDARAPTATAFTPDTLAQLRDACSPGTRDRLPHALGVAAVRETFEETGLRLGASTCDGVLPDLAALRYVGRAITPTALSRRFDARFFEADAMALDHRVAAPSTELDDVAWFTFEAALALDLVAITRVLVLEAQRRVADPRRAPVFLSARQGAARRMAAARVD